MEVSCTRGTALSITAAQLVALVTVMCLYTDKRPIFAYTTSVSYRDVISALNQTKPGLGNITLLLEDKKEIRAQQSVNPFIPTHTAADMYFVTDSLNPVHSFATLSIVSAFGLFVAGAVAAVGFSFLTIQMMQSSAINCDAAYGDHGGYDAIGWELLFWLFTWLNHTIVCIVMSSPADLIYATTTSFALVVLLGAFAYISCTSLGEGEGGISVSRRFEMPVLILLCLCYVVFLSNSKIVVSPHFTYMLWLAYMAFDGLLLLGHAWDNPVNCSTVVNCRWSYVNMCAWMNVMLYVAF